MNIANVLDKEIMSQLDFESEEQQVFFLEELSSMLINRVIDRVSHILGTQEQQAIITSLSKDADISELFSALGEKLPYFFFLVGQEMVSLKYDILEQLDDSVDTKVNVV